MNWQPGLIIRINNYRFDDDGSQRDKYAIVLKANHEELYIIHCLTTSQNNPGISPNGHGCNVERNIPYYFIEANRIIGNEGYFFEKDTFIFFLQNVRKEAIEKPEKLSRGPFDLVSLGLLTTEELKRLLKCVLKSKYLTTAVKAELTGFKDSPPRSDE